MSDKAADKPTISPPEPTNRLLANAYDFSSTISAHSEAQTQQAFVPIWEMPGHNEHLPKSFTNHTYVTIERQVFEVPIPDGKTKAQIVAEFTKQKSQEILNHYNQQRAALGLAPVDRLPGESIAHGYVPLPQAKLPATPGINAPAPPTLIPRSGIPLVPLGDKH